MFSIFICSTVNQESKGLFLMEGPLFQNENPFLASFPQAELLSNLNTFLPYEKIEHSSTWRVGKIGQNPWLPGQFQMSGLTSIGLCFQTVS